MNLEMDITNAVLMYNNSRHANAVWPGEQGVENQNQVFNAFPLGRGKIGYTRALQKLTCAQLMWNRRMLNYHLKHPEKLKKCDFSAELIDKMNDILEKERDIGVMMDIRGVKKI